jgi:hypothetical protein
MIEYRVTKYDPAHRDPLDNYTRDEWTSVSDVGRSFGGVVLTRAEYQQVEDAYVAAAIALLREAGVTAVVVAGLENHAGLALDFGDGSALDLDRAGEVLRRALREELWCQLQAPRGDLRVGYDYYLYVGVSRPCPRAVALAERLGLFVEAGHPLQQGEGEPPTWVPHFPSSPRPPSPPTCELLSASSAPGSPAPSSSPLPPFAPPPRAARPA